MGCNLTLCASTTSPDCATGVCVWDGRTGFDAYCSQVCGDGPCPGGWTCLALSDGQGRACFADPAVCGNGILERGEVCDPGPGVGTPSSGCVAGCRSPLAGGSVSFAWDGSPTEVIGTSADGTVTSHVGGGIVELSFVGSDLQLGVRIAEADLAGPLPRTVRGRVTATYPLASWCFSNPAGNTLAPVITVETWEAGTHLVGSFDGEVTYGRCCDFCVDPEITAHRITASRFDVYLQE